MRQRLAMAAMVAAGLAGCAGGSSDTTPPTARCHVRGHGVFVLPDARCTPGAVDARVREDNIYSTICRRGYTRTVRPPSEETGREKRMSMTAYGDAGEPSAYEYDHLIPLSLGGAPNDARNLWPEPGASPNPKDRLESRLRRAVCRGSLPLGSAQRQIAENWVRAYAAWVGPAGAG